MELYAPSTVAMTAYNVLAIKGEVVSMSNLFVEIEQHLPGLKKSMLSNALAEIKKRGLVKSCRKGFEIIDRKRRPIISRDINGDGWDSWMIMDAQRGSIPIEEVLR